MAKIDNKLIKDIVEFEDEEKLFSLFYKKNITEEWTKEVVSRSIIYSPTHHWLGLILSVLPLSKETWEAEIRDLINQYLQTEEIEDEGWDDYRTAEEILRNYSSGNPRSWYFWEGENGINKLKKDGFICNNNEIVAYFTKKELDNWDYQLNHWMHEYIHLDILPLRMLRTTPEYLKLNLPLFEVVIPLDQILWIDDLCSDCNTLVKTVNISRNFNPKEIRKCGYWRAGSLMPSEKG